MFPTRAGLLVFLLFTCSIPDERLRTLASTRSSAVWSDTYSELTQNNYAIRRLIGSASTFQSTTHNFLSSVSTAAKPQVVYDWIRVQLEDDETHQVEEGTGALMSDLYDSLQVRLMSFRVVSDVHQVHGAEYATFGIHEERSAESQNSHEPEGDEDPTENFEPVEPVREIDVVLVSPRETTNSRGETIYEPRFSENIVIPDRRHMNDQELSEVEEDVQTRLEEFRQNTQNVQVSHNIQSGGNLNIVQGDQQIDQRVTHVTPRSTETDEGDRLSNKDGENKKKDKNKKTESTPWYYYGILGCIFGPKRKEDKEDEDSSDGSTQQCGRV